MIIGVPKEIKIREYRVGLAPASVRELTERARLKKESDPVLLEYRNQNGSEEVSA